ncbi:hypothetical protein RAS1_43900 [Phycisphaerae bacterium RAS1]|nr:hypothetical protein RAS1_43900 [Phycisphaerae bacterium RAS1]
MTIALYVIGLIAAIAIYLAVVFTQVPGAFEERFGKLFGVTPLPPDCGEWKADEASSVGMAARAEGLRREVRFWVDEPGGALGRRRVLRQVRYVDAGGQVVRTEPDQRATRSELRQASR